MPTNKEITASKQAYQNTITRMLQGQAMMAQGMANLGGLFMKRVEKGLQIQAETIKNFRERYTEPHSYGKGDTTLADAAMSLTPFGGIIDSGMWKAMQPEGKALLSLLASKFPDKFAQALRKREFLTAQVNEVIDPLVPSVAGQLIHLSKETSMLQVRPDHAKDISVTPIHELTHFLEGNRVKRTAPDDAETIGILIAEALEQAGKLTPWEAGSVLNTMRRLGSKSPGFEGKPFELVGSKARETINAGLSRQVKSMASPVVDEQNVYFMGQTTIRDHDRRLLMDEGLAYLASLSVQPDAHPMLVKLAKALKVYPE